MINTIQPAWIKLDGVDYLKLGRVADIVVFPKLKNYK